MVIIPEHIERYLADLNFTATEVIILKKLLEGDSYTLREIAAKTGKSTGVLDQAMKKLLRKNIVKRTTVNQTPKYVLESCEDLLRWVREDLEQRWNHWHRRGKDLEQFLGAAQEKKSRPSVRYFEGKDGIERLRTELADMPYDQCVYFPSASFTKEADHDFEKKLLSLRRKNGTEVRVLTTDTPEGRRYKSRDPFCLRCTQLCPDATYRFDEEKIIIGGHIACINEETQRATLLHHPVLAETERLSFGVLWQFMEERKDALLTESHSHQMESRAPEAPLSTFSQWYARILPDVPHWMYGIMVSLRILPRAQSKHLQGEVCSMRIHALDRKRMVSDIAGSFASQDINLIRFRIYAVPSRSSVYDVKFEARDDREISTLTKALERVPDVLAVRKK